MCQDYGPNVKYINWNNEEIPAPGHGELEPPTGIWYTLDRNVAADFDVDWSTVTKIEIRFDHGGGYLHQDQFKVYFDDLELEGSPVPLSVSIDPTSTSMYLGESVVFTSKITGGTPSYTYQWYLDNNPVSSATSDSWTFTPTITGTYTIYLNVTDSLGNSTKSNDATITVASQLSTSISPTSASILVDQSVIFTSTVSGGYTPYIYQWYLNGVPVLGATSASWTFTPTTSGIYYIYLKVTDAEANSSQSDTARIAVTGVPVGGYSIPIQVHTKAEPIVPYIALVVALTAIFNLRRKIKRKP
jgi:hypothetical protein